jgi:hypothetical protein
MQIPSRFAILPMLLCLWFVPLAHDVHAQEKQAAAPADGVEASSKGYFPKAFKRDRHEKTWASSPFSREVLPPPPPEIKRGPDPWEGWKLCAIDRFDGKYTVGLTDKKNKFHVLKVGEENEDGITITKVESNGRLKDTVIHLAEGSRTGTIEFASSRLSMAAKGAPVPKSAPKKSATYKPGTRPHGMTKEQAAALLKKKAEQQKTIRDAMMKASQKKPEPKRRSVVLPPK